MMHAMNNPPVQPAAAPEPLTIAGPVGKIEAVIDPPEGTPQPVLAIVCHPLPTEGGTMHNKVVTMTARALRESGVTVLRYTWKRLQEDPDAVVAEIRAAIAGEMAGDPERPSADRLTRRRHRAPSHGRTDRTTRKRHTPGLVGCGRRVAGSRHGEK